MKELVERQLKEQLEIMGRDTPTSRNYEQAAEAAERLSLMLQRIETAKAYHDLGKLAHEIITHGFRVR
jgi:hypothetical protein